MTPDEKFLIRLYQLAIEKGDPKARVSFLKVAKSLGQKENEVRNAIKLLAKANMVLKMEDDASIALADRGISLAIKLMQ